MRFNCGITFNEKRRRRWRWHRWFAWHPVTIKIEGGERRCAWLEDVWRRGEYQCWAYSAVWKWEYAPRGVFPPPNPPLPEEWWVTAP